MDRLIFLFGCLSAGVAVAAGAFAAHALRDKLKPELLNAFEVGVKYQMYHALALLAVAWAVGHWPNSSAYLAGWLFIAGTILFSGSLYAMSLSGLRWLGAITPVGGLLFIAGWLYLGWTLFQQRGV
jgi:uncharacterized membrane protein YgdD (TMEM256/DUF423 family)